MEELRARLEEAEQALAAIRHGEVDAIVVQGPKGEKVFTLQGADQPYRVMVEAMNEGAFTITPDGTVLYANVRFAEMLGVPPERVIGSSIRSYVTPDDLGTLDVLIAGAGMDSRRGEIGLRAAAGRVVRVSLSLNPFQFDDTRTICVIASDLTGAQWNQELVASERLARAILDQAADAIVVCNTEGRVMRASQLAFGLTGESPMQRPFEEAFRLELHALAELGPPREGRMGAAQLLEAVLNGRSFRALEGRLLRTRGEAFDVLVGAGPLVFGEEIRGAVIVFSNITAQKQAERRLALQHAVSAALSRAATVDEAARGVLSSVCTTLQADCGELWRLDPETDSLSCLHSWEAKGIALTESAYARRRHHFSRREGLPGRIWAEKRPLFTAEVAHDVLLPGSPFVGESFAAAFGFPVAIGDRVLGSAVFFCRAIPAIDDQLLEVLAGMGREAGQFMERKRVEEESLHQREAIRALSTPVLKVRDRLLILPLIGVIDAARAKQLTDQLLAAVRQNRARAVVIDITGVAALDFGVAGHLVRTVQAARLLGARTILCGISRSIAQTVSSIDIDMSLIQTVGDLQRGIEEANYMLGFEVTPIQKPPRAAKRAGSEPEAGAPKAFEAAGWTGGEPEDTAEDDAAPID